MACQSEEYSYVEPDAGPSVAHLAYNQGCRMDDAKCTVAVFTRKKYMADQLYALGQRGKKNTAF